MILGMNAFEKFAELLVGLFLGCSGIQRGLRISVGRPAEVAWMCWGKERLQHRPCLSSGGAERRADLCR